MMNEKEFLCVKIAMMASYDIEKENPLYSIDVTMEHLDEEYPIMKFSVVSRDNGYSCKGVIGFRELLLMKENIYERIFNEIKYLLENIKNFKI